MTTWAMPAGSGNRWPDDYERGRPGWPSAGVEVAGLPRSAAVLDLGAGTGKLTRLLVDAFERVIAVEPADEMRRRLVALCPHAEALAGSGQEIPLADASVDAVFAAQAFHWFDDEWAVAEIVRVLRPGGALVVMWNVPASAREPWLQAVEELLTERLPPGEYDYDPLDLGMPKYRAGDWRRALAAAPFTHFEEARRSSPQRLDREGVVAFYASMGWVADLRDAQRLPLLDEVRSLLTDDEYVRLWETHVHWARCASSTNSQTK